MISIFLSSTFKDFEDYRKEVSDALEEAGWARAKKLEDAAGAYDDTIEVCENEFKASNAFMLLLAHWYGSIPPSEIKSITHLEFEWAWQRWKDHKRRPMAVLMPADGSPADLELKAKTENLLKSATQDYRDKHPKRLADFRGQVTENWRRVMYFPTRERAARKAMVAYFQWKDHTPMRAALHPGAVAGDEALCSEASLGSLGREFQLSVFRHEMSWLRLNAEAPGAAFLVTGDEVSGHAEFLAHLTRGGDIKGRPARTALLPSAGFPAERLAGWASEQFGFSGGDRAETIPELAAKLAGELRNQSMTLVLGSLEHLAGGVPAFQQQFWKPLYHALADLRVRRPFKHRVLAIAAEYDQVQDAWDDCVQPLNPASAPADYDRLLLLPELNEITANHLALWLDENGVAMEQRSTAVLGVLKGKLTVPARAAFDRLKRQNLRYEEGEFD